MTANTTIPISRPLIGDAEREAVMRVLDSGMLVQGPEVVVFETEFATAVGTRHAVAASSGTTALHMALLAHGVGPGDEVIIPAFTFIASANSILHAGATPVLVDIEPETFNIDVGRLEAAITPRTKAIMPVHLYGQPADMAEIGELAAAHGLAVIEDAAQAIGASYRGRMAGSLGTGVFSLYATKNVMSGEGGMITTDDEALADRLRLLRNHGMRARYQHESLGYNFRMTDLCAAIGRAQLARLGELTERRAANARALSAGITAATVPPVRADRTHCWHQYTIRFGKDRDRRMANLRAAGVGTAIFYPRPVHGYDYMRRHTGDVSMPVAEAAATEVLSLPVHPQLSEGDLERIVAEVNRA